MSQVTYSSYLGLPELLSAVRPITSEQRSRVRAAEHFFIVAHQTSELWIKQVLLDLNQAVSELSGPDRHIELATDLILLGSAATRVLVEHVAILKRLPPQDFAEFRHSLGRASGNQSAQLHQLRRLLGLCGQDSPLTRRLTEALAEQSLTLTSIYQDPARRNGPLHRLAESMVELSQAFWQWQLTHIEAAAYEISNAPGTGGTNGVRHLAERLAPPFPELWEARTILHTQLDTRTLGRRPGS